jgi:uncharacterized protein with HEPN domain
MSKKSRQDLDLLYDIQWTIDRAMEYTQGMTWEEYLKDYKTQDAVVYNLEILGEATKNLSEEIRYQYPAIPWRNMAGIRDRLIHHYFGINQEIVWQIVQQDLPDLKVQITKVITEITSIDI